MKNSYEQLNTEIKKTKEVLTLTKMYSISLSLTFICALIVKLTPSLDSVNNIYFYCIYQLDFIFRFYIFFLVFLKPIKSEI